MKINGINFSVNYSKEPEQKASGVKLGLNFFGHRAAAKLCVRTVELRFGSHLIKLPGLHLALTHKGNGTTAKPQAAEQKWQSVQPVKERDPRLNSLRAALADKKANVIEHHSQAPAVIPPPPPPPPPFSPLVPVVKQFIVPVVKEVAKEVGIELGKAVLNMVDDSRANLLADIQRGINLKPVGKIEKRVDEMSITSILQRRFESIPVIDDTPKYSKKWDD
ncbi:MAG: hypothetical protein Q8K75_11720 [Chlamydiales bacterium]|nr:hypothetical protein [Chlamydiales bacterium]